MSDYLFPRTPVVKGLEHLEIVYAKDQPQYLPLPVLPIDDGSGQNRVVSRWKLSWRGRLRVLCSGNLYLWVSTFGDPLQPLAMSSTPPEIVRR